MSGERRVYMSPTPEVPHYVGVNRSDEGTYTLLVWALGPSGAPVVQVVLSASEARKMAMALMDQLDQSRPTI